MHLSLASLGTNGNEKFVPNVLKTREFPSHPYYAQSLVYMVTIPFKEEPDALLEFLCDRILQSVFLRFQQTLHSLSS